PIREMMHGADDCEPIRPLRQPGEIFAEADAGQLRLRRPVLAADDVEGVGLGVERLVLRRAARLEDEDDRLRPTPGWLHCLSLKAQEIRQTSPKQAEAAGLKQLAPSDLGMVLSPASDSVHGQPPGQASLSFPPILTAATATSALFQVERS